MDLKAATQRMQQYLATLEREMDQHWPATANHPPARLVISETTEYDFGWVFCYDTKEFLETGDFRFALAGNAPIIADKTDGHLYCTGTAHGLEHYLEEYRRGKLTPI